MASSLISTVLLSWCRGLRDAGFLRGDLAFLAAGWRGIAVQRCFLGRRFRFVGSFAFVGMTKTDIAVLSPESDSQAVFAKDWREGKAFATYVMRHFVFPLVGNNGGCDVALQLFTGSGTDSAGSLIGAALLLGILNAFVRPVLLILSAPLILVTLGFFILIVNGLLLWFVPNIVTGFHVDNFWSAFWARS